MYLNFPTIGQQLNDLTIEKSRALRTPAEAIINAKLNDRLEHATNVPRIIKRRS
jgi:hypothetical protein